MILLVLQGTLEYKVKNTVDKTYIYLFWSKKSCVIKLPIHEFVFQSSVSTIEENMKRKKKVKRSRSDQSCTGSDNSDSSSSPDPSAGN